MRKRPLHLAVLLPVYRIIRRYWPQWCVIPQDILPDVYASAMLPHGNSLFRLIFPPFFKKIKFEIADENELLRASREGTIVYVAPRIGQLEYNYFAHLFREVGLPPSSFVNGISFRRWMPWREYKATLITQVEAIEKKGGIANPVTSGWLTDLVVNGKSALLSLSPSELEDESILLSYSQKFLASIVKAQRNGSRPIFLVPLEFVWDRRPSRAERSLIDILFGEKENPGRIRKIALFWRNYNSRALARIGEPIDLAKFLGEKPQEKEDAQARRLGQKLYTTIRQERRAVTGPLIRSKSWFQERVLADETFQQTICELAASLSKPADDLRELAGRYVKEIAADINYTYIELGEILLRWAIKSLYSGLIFNEEGLSQAKRLYAKAPVVFVSNHKSHVDYLLLSHILYNNNMTVPHVAAGLNLSFWPLGPIFRHCGAYFIRRSFENNQLYRAAVETYLRVLLEEGYSQEFFIEGGRSRTGKLMDPRHGMLRMLSKAVTSGAVKDINFIPVSFTYDRVIEQKTYEEEMAGGAKEKESPSHLLRLIKYVKRQKPRYGRIYVNFGRPVSYQEGQKGGMIENIAQEICREINKNIVVTPQSIVAATLLTHSERAMTFDAICERAALFIDWLSAKGVGLSLSIKSGQKSAITRALKQLVAGHYVTLNQELEEPLYSVDEDKRLKLDYFKNGCVHFFASIGVVATLLLKHKEYTEEQLEEDFNVCKDLLKYEFRFATRGPVSLHIRKILDFLAAKGGGESTLYPFSNMIINFFESIKIALSSIKRQKIEKAQEKDLIKMMMATGKNMLLLGHIRHREAISKSNFQNAIRLIREKDPANLQVQLERLL